MSGSSVFMLQTLQICTLPTPSSCVALSLCSVAVLIVSHTHTVLGNWSNQFYKEVFTSNSAHLVVFAVGSRSKHLLWGSQGNLLLSTGYCPPVGLADLSALMWLFLQHCSFTFCMYIVPTHTVFDFQSHFSFAVRTHILSWAYNSMRWIMEWFRLWWHMWDMGCNMQHWEVATGGRSLVRPPSELAAPGKGKTVWEGGDDGFPGH